MEGTALNAVPVFAGSCKVDDHAHSKSDAARATPPTVLDVWAAFVIELAIVVQHGVVSKADAVDRLQAEAARAGLIEIHGQDVIQRAMALAFEARWR